MQSGSEGSLCRAYATGQASQGPLVCHRGPRRCFKVGGCQERSTLGGSGPCGHKPGQDKVAWVTERKVQGPEKHQMIDSIARLYMFGVYHFCLPQNNNLIMSNGRYQDVSVPCERRPPPPPLSVHECAADVWNRNSHRLSPDDHDETSGGCNKGNGNNLIFHWSSASICLRGAGEIYRLLTWDKWMLTPGHTRTCSSLSRGAEHFIRAARRGQGARQPSKDNCARVSLMYHSSFLCSAAAQTKWMFECNVLPQCIWWSLVWMLICGSNAPHRALLFIISAASCLTTRW